MNEVLRPRHEMPELLVNVPAYAFFNTVKFRNKPRGLYFSQALFEGLIFGRAYIRRGLIKYEGELSFQNRLSLYLEEKLRLKIGWANL